MGSSKSIIKLNFEDMQYVIKHNNIFLLINTLDDNDQNCLILNTIHATKEIELLNTFIQNNNKNVNIIIYGKNSNDHKLLIKYNQLISLGFYNVYIYPGGIFEWLLLQDVYGEIEFPTTKKELDFLKYKATKSLNVLSIEYNKQF
jgi:hypothetical protein